MSAARNDYPARSQESLVPAWNLFDGGKIFSFNCKTATIEDTPPARSMPPSADISPVLFLLLFCYVAITYAPARECKVLVKAGVMCTVDSAIQSGPYFLPSHKQIYLSSDSRLLFVARSPSFISLATNIWNNL
ncbi:hypothetical protein J6590_047538 [Homalodisca vitripennis]|nr:hypothetical protein J6590_047538 [Homalodisca vitripennis]